MKAYALLMSIIMVLSLLSTNFVMVKAQEQQNIAVLKDSATEITGKGTYSITKAEGSYTVESDADWVEEGALIKVTLEPHEGYRILSEYACFSSYTEEELGKFSLNQFCYDETAVYNATDVDRVYYLWVTNNAENDAITVEVSDLEFVTSFKDTPLTVDGAPVPVINNDIVGYFLSPWYDDDWNIENYEIDVLSCKLFSVEVPADETYYVNLEYAGKDLIGKVEEPGGINSACYLVDEENKQITNIWGGGEGFENSIYDLTIDNYGNSEIKKVYILVTIIQEGEQGLQVSVTSDRVLSEDEKVPVTDIILKVDNKTLVEGETYTLEYDVLPENATNSIIDWSSSNTNVVEVDTLGNITAIGVGEAIVTASATDGSGVKATCDISVVDGTYPALSEVLDKAYEIEGGEFTLSAQAEKLTVNMPYVEWTENDQETKYEVRTGYLYKFTIPAKLRSYLKIMCEEGDYSESLCLIEDVDWGINQELYIDYDRMGYGYTCGLTSYYDNSRDIYLWVDEDYDFENPYVTYEIYSKDFNMFYGDVNVEKIELDKDYEVYESIAELYFYSPYYDDNWEVMDYVIGSIYCKPYYIEIPADSTYTLSYETISDVIYDNDFDITCNGAFYIIDEDGKEVTNYWFSNYEDEYGDASRGELYIENDTSGTRKYYIAATCSSSIDSEGVKFNIKDDSEISVSTIVLGKTNLTLEEGDNYIVSAVVVPSNATNQNIKWSSSNTAVATVDTTGKVTAVKAGIATITATAADGSEKKASCTVTVKSVTPPTTEAPTTEAPTTEEPVTPPVEKPTPKVDVTYHTHIQTLGDTQGTKKNGEMAGTSGMAKRLENIWIDVEGNDNLGIQYTTHCQTYGWMPWSCDGESNGTSGEAKRLEAIMIQLTGADKDKYDVYYRVHAQSYGWLGWAKNGEPSGTAGYGKRLEGIQVVVVKKGEAAPGLKYAGVDGSSSKYGKQAYVAKTNGAITIPGNTGEPNLMYKTHVQTFGWQKWVTNGQMSGTSGKAKRLEGINIKLSNAPYDGDIVYTTHVQKYGWKDGKPNADKSTWKKNGEMSGTNGEAKRLEAICIDLTGEMAEHYDVYYRVHAQTFGWLGWAKNGEESGTAGYAKRLEGIQIVLVEKGGKAPDNNYGGITSKDARPFVEKR